MPRRRRRSRPLLILTAGAAVAGAACHHDAKPTAQPTPPAPPPTFRPMRIGPPPFHPLATTTSDRATATAPIHTPDGRIGPPVTPHIGPDPRRIEGTTPAPPPTMILRIGPPATPGPIVGSTPKDDR